MYNALDYCSIDSLPRNGNFGTCTPYLYADQTCTSFNFFFVIYVSFTQHTHLHTHTHTPNIFIIGEFECNANFTLSQSTLCVRGEPNILQPGQCIPKNSDVISNPINYCTYEEQNEKGFTMEFKATDFGGIPCCGGTCDDFEACRKLIHFARLTIPVWNPFNSSIGGETYSEKVFSVANSTIPEEMPEEYEINQCTFHFLKLFFFSYIFHTTNTK